MSSYIDSIIAPGSNYSATYKPIPVDTMPTTGCALPPMLATGTSVFSLVAPTATKLCTPLFLNIPPIPEPFVLPENCPSGISFNAASWNILTATGVPALMDTPLSATANQVVGGGPCLYELSLPDLIIPCYPDGPKVSLDAYSLTFHDLTVGSTLGDQSAILSQEDCLFKLSGGIINFPAIPCYPNGVSLDASTVSVTAVIDSELITVHPFSFTNTGCAWTLSGSVNLGTFDSVCPNSSPACTAGWTVDAPTIKLNGTTLAGGTAVVQSSVCVSQVGGDTCNLQVIMPTLSLPEIDLPIPVCTLGMTYQPGSSQVGIKVTKDGSTILPQVVSEIRNYTYTTGQYIIDTTHGNMWQGTSGVTGSGVPSWPTSPTIGSTTITDGGVTWTCRGNSGALPAYSSVQLLSQNDNYLLNNPSSSSVPTANLNCGALLLGEINLGLPAFATACSAIVPGTNSSITMITPATGAYYSGPAGGGGGLVATAHLSGTSVTSVSVSNSGSGYGASPGINFTAIGPGSGASAYAMVVGGQIEYIIVTNIGSGYTSAPTVSATDIAAPSLGLKASDSGCGLQFTSPNLYLPLISWPCQNGYTINNAVATDRNYQIQITNVKDTTGTLITQPTPLTLTPTPCGFAVSGQLTVNVAGGGGGGASMEITDGVTDLTGVSKINLVGATLTGTAANATITVPPATWI